LHIFEYVIALVWVWGSQETNIEKGCVVVSFTCARKAMKTTHVSRVAKRERNLVKSTSCGK
jgi:hypothetical protein